MARPLINQVETWGSPHTIQMFFCKQAALTKLKHTDETLNFLAAGDASLKDTLQKSVRVLGQH